MSFSGASDGKESVFNAWGSRFNRWVGKFPWRRAWKPTPVFLPEESHDRGAWRAIVYGLQRVRSDWATNTHNDLLKLTKFHVHLCHQLYPDVGKIRGDANFPLGVSRIPIMCHSPFKYNPKENRFSDVFCLSYWGLFFSSPARETILLRYSPRVFQKMLQKNIQTNTPAFCPF